MTWLSFDYARNFLLFEHPRRRMALRAEYTQRGQH